MKEVCNYCAVQYKTAVETGTSRTRRYFVLGPAVLSPSDVTSNRRKTLDRNGPNKKKDAH
jgi:hypothetical protein